MTGRCALLLGAWILLVAWSGSSLAAVGRLDPGFGLDGRVAVELAARNGGYAVLVQADGRIVVAGSSDSGGGQDFTLLRFYADGSLDPSFGGEGSVITPISRSDDEALALGRLADGRIIAAGYSDNGSDRDFALACYRQDGTLDTAFGDKGVVLTAIGNGNEEITALSVDAEDRITVVGASEGTFGRVLVAARFLDSGDLDPAFGEAGVSLVGVGADATAEGVIRRPDGSLVLSGSYRENRTVAMMLVGLDHNGLLDMRFGSKGVAALPGPSASEGYKLAEDESGRIYVAGAVGEAGSREAGLFRFTADGRPDSSFGEGGVLITRAGAGDDVLYDLVLDRNGLVAGGYSTEDRTRRILIAAFQGLGGNADPLAGKAIGPEPVEKVWVNGDTRIQLRKLQVPTANAGRVHVRRLMTEASLRQYISPLGGVGEARVDMAPQIERFLHPHGSQGETGAQAGLPAAQILSARFGDGESVGYALTSDSDGNILAVGTADNAGISSIVVARYAAEIVEDAVVDQPGHRSSRITTSETAEVTRNTITIEAAISETFGQTVVRRGLVFDVRPLPVFSADSAHPARARQFVTEPPAGASGLRLSQLTDVLSSLLVSEALAAPGPGEAAPGSAGERLLLRGETDNGSGTGSFSAVLSHLKPGTVYYLRSYAQTAGGEVYYGNQRSFRTSDACFIATASYGTLSHPGVGILRQFRDTVLGRSGIGQRLVECYYSYSPPLAEALAAHPFWRSATRVALLPVIGFSWLTLHLGASGSVLGALLTGVLLARGCRRRF